jgi:hypothetical protein
MDNTDLETKRQSARDLRRTDKEMMTCWGCAGIGVGKRRVLKVLGRSMVAGADIQGGVPYRAVCNGGNRNHFHRNNLDAHPCLFLCRSTCSRGVAPAGIVPSPYPSSTTHQAQVAKLKVALQESTTASKRPVGVTLLEWSSVHEALQGAPVIGRGGFGVVYGCLMSGGMSQAPRVGHSRRRYFSSL